MLYHWYELDLEATAPTCAESELREPSCAPVIAFDQSAAIAHSRHGGLGFNNQAILADADNDTRPDPIAIRLRNSGLGVIGNPDHRRTPGDYSLPRQSRKLASYIFALLRNYMIRLPALLSYPVGKIAACCSHTMVANDAEGELAERDGAQRQRFTASRRQPAN